MNSAPIALFDSGLGGLSVWSELRRGLPHESLIYYGDGKNCPYGGRDEAEIRGFVDEAVRRLVDRGAKMVVLACNTATAAAVEHLRATYPIPFVGLEPAVKPAALNTKSGTIAILATATSLKGRLFRQTSARYASTVNILSAVGEGFVELVEQSKEDTPEAEQAVRRIVEPLIAQGADHIVLGCTHYPFLKRALERVIDGRDITLVNPSSAIERRVESLLSEYDIAAAADNIPDYSFCTSADEYYMQKIIAKSEEALRLL